jgi:hypothetical protein
MGWKLSLRRWIGRRALGALAVALAVGFASAPGFAAERDDIKAGSKVGAQIPYNLSTLDQDGQHQDFKSLAHKRGLLILFSRSFDW